MMHLTVENTVQDYEKFTYNILNLWEAENTACSFYNPTLIQSCFR